VSGSSPAKGGEEPQTHIRFFNLEIVLNHYLIIKKRLKSIDKVAKI
jgi:hypothetical protein